MADEPKVVAAAIKYRGVICSLPRPARHNDIIYALARAGQETPIVGEQGFLDDSGEFLTRKQAMMIAVVAGQVKSGQEQKRELFSEDVW